MSIKQITPEKRKMNPFALETQTGFSQQEKIPPLEVKTQKGFSLEDLLDIKGSERMVMKKRDFRGSEQMILQKRDFMGSQRTILEYKDFSRRSIMKNAEGNRVFVGCRDGYLYEYSMYEEKITHDFGKVLAKSIFNLATTFDNKYLFVSDRCGGFREYDISTRNEVKNFKIGNARCCVVTYDNKFLITSSDGRNVKLNKYSVRTNQDLWEWDSTVDEYIYSQNCSQDSKYQFIGYGNGQLEIFNIQKNETFKNIQVLSTNIYSVAFTKDNQRAFISDLHGKIKMIKWKPNAKTIHDFNFTQRSIQFRNSFTFYICLTRDDKNLLVGSKGLVSIFNTRTRKLVNRFKLNSYVQGIKLTDGKKSAFIAEQNGDLTIINLETMEMSTSHKNVADGKELQTNVLI